MVFKVVEIKWYKNMKKQQVNVKRTQMEGGEEDSNSDDVCVVGKVTYFKKYPKGVLLGPRKSYDHIIRRRKSSEPFVMRGSLVRRSNTSINFRHFCSYGIRKLLFDVDEVIRLEEKRRYLKLMEAIHNTVNIHYYHPLQFKRDAMFSSTKQRPPPKPKLSEVECIDLVSDSESDVVELPRELSPSNNDIEELPHSDDSVIDLEEEPQTEVLETASSKTPEEIESTSSTSTCLTQDWLKEKIIAISCSESSDSSENEDEIFPTKHDTSKGNLEDRILHQMIIHDDAPDVIVGDNDKLNKVEKKKLQEDQEIEEEESFLEITHKMQMLVHKAFTSPADKVLVEDFHITIHGKDIHTLKGSTWLNDEVINFYMCMLMERGKQGSYPSVYCFSTFFYVKLLESGHVSLKRWTRKVDVFSYELLIVPVHLKVHWCLACVNFIEKRIEYYDSMRGVDDECGKKLLQYLEDEHFDKKKEIFNTSGWTLMNMENIPEQLNGSDCGVFVCTYAEYICRLAELKFTQNDMPYFRVKIAYEVLTKKLLL